MKYFTPLLLVVVAIVLLFAFRTPNSTENIKYQYKQFSTIESVVAGGLGRSRILVTDENGQLLEKELQNFFSLVGINFGNIANNDRAIVNKINEWTDEGWDLFEVTNATHGNISNGSTSGAIFITRYLFRRPKN